MRERLHWLTPSWPAPAQVRAATTLRTGGVSTGIYDSLNLATHVGDDSVAVTENRRRVRDTLPLPAEPYWLQQVHGDTVVETSQQATLPNADASVARTANQVCVVLTADCLPVLFCSRSGDRVAAAHAGWRGLAAGILDATVSALGLPGHELLAWLGPAIGAQAFEVGDDVRIAFLARTAAAAAAFKPNHQGRWQADLYALARIELARLNIKAVYGGNLCTVTEAARFFSYRRDGQTGRMGSFIWMTE